MDLKNKRNHIICERGSPYHPHLDFMRYLADKRSNFMWGRLKFQLNLLSWRISIPHEVILFAKKSHSINHTVLSWVILQSNLLIIFARRDQVSTTFCFHRFSWSQTWSYNSRGWSTYHSHLAIRSYLAVKQINHIREEGSRHQLQLYYNKLSCSHTY